MNCARHTNIQAIGICSSCGRAMCIDCARTELAGKLVCSPECQRDILTHDAAVTAILTKANKSSKTSGLFSIAAGVAFMSLGIYHVFFNPVPILIALGLVLGVIFLVAGAFYLRNSREKSTSSHTQ